MAVKFKIRKFKKTDTRQVCVLHHELDAFHGHKTKITSKQFLKTLKLTTCLVAEADKKIIGFAISFDRPSFQTGKRICVVDLLHTHEDFRRSGIGVALMRGMTAAAIKRGCDKLEVKASRNNKTSNAFYKKIGFFLQLHTSNKYVIVHKTMPRFAKGKI